MMLLHVSHTIVVVGTAAICLMATGIIVFALAYRKKFIARQLAYQQELLTASVASQERERERIAQELHDGIGALLSAAKILVHRLPTEGERDELLPQLKEVLAQTVQEVRTISRGLSPLLVRRQGVVEALENYCQLLSKAEDIRIDFSFQNMIKSNNFQAELSLYRIAQELIHNALQHASATHITVSLTAQSGSLRLTVADDGQGFDLSTAQQRGLGLLDIYHRLQPLRGNMHQLVLSQPGSCLAVDIPTTSFTQTTT